jgi:hypothetical protein
MIVDFYLAALERWLLFCQTLPEPREGGADRCSGTGPLCLARLVHHPAHQLVQGCPCNNYQINYITL